MKPQSILRSTITALLALGLTSACAHAQTTTSERNVPIDHNAIQSTIDANNNGVAAKDMTAILSTYETGAAMVGPQGDVATGTEALRAAFAGFLAANPKITVVKSDLAVASDIALHTYSWTMTGQTPDGHSFQQQGLSAIVLRKQADGKWLMVIDHPFADKVLNRPN
jgi:uncharacterized protein (TIGR02246 family)